MKMDTWMRCHIRMYEAFGGVPIRTVCDNLKTDVIKHPKEGEIILSDAYEALGLHYVTAIMLVFTILFYISAHWSHSAG